MKQVILFSFICICSFSCEGNKTVESENGDSQTTLSEDELGEDSSMNEFNSEFCENNLFCFKGSIDNQYPIYLEFNKNYYNEEEDVYSTAGYYVYTNNNSCFDLEGHQEGDTLRLRFWQDGELNEKFQLVQQSPTNYSGWWQKEDGDKKEVEIESISYPEANGLILKKGLDAILANDMNANLLLDYSEFDNIYTIDNSCISGDFDEFSIAQHKIFYSSFMESSASGHNDRVIYTNLPTNHGEDDSNRNYYAQIEWQNGWENNYHDPEIDEDDEYVINPWYIVTVTVFVEEEGEVNDIQQIIWEGKGKARVYYFENTVLMLAGETKEVLYYSINEKAFVEH